MKDPLGDRMKNQYEDRTRYSLPRRTFTVIRLDGKSFHTYTKNCRKPFDQSLSDDLDKAIIEILPEIHGAVFAYTQSDEISILVTDFKSIETNAWFDGNIQKIASVSTSMMTAEFNKNRILRDVKELQSAYMFNHDYAEDIKSQMPAYFDARVFSIPDRIEVMNYFIWRNNDCSRNSVSMCGQHHFSHKELQEKSTKQVMEMLVGIQQPWDFIDEAWKYGRLIVKKDYQVEIPNKDKNVKSEFMIVNRTNWVSNPAWKFVENKESLLEMIPKYE